MSNNYQDFNFQIPNDDRNNSAGNMDDAEGSYKRLLQGKEITWLWLMQHYSKENAAAYKAQQEAKKGMKKSSKKTEPVPCPQPAPYSQPQPAPQPAPYSQPTPQPPVVEADGYGKTVYKPRTLKGNRVVELECVAFGQNVTIDKSPYRIGRDAQKVDLCIGDNDSLGRQHADIISENGHYYIVDLNSVNHTYVNDVEVPAGIKKEIFDNDKIELSDEMFVFHVTRR